MNTPNENYQEHQTHNTIEIHQSGHQIHGRHTGIDLALGLIGALLALVAIVAVFIFGIIALPFALILALAWVVKGAMS